MCQPNFHWSEKRKGHYCNYDLSRATSEYKEKWEKDEYGTIDGRMVLRHTCPTCKRQEDTEL